MITTGAAFDNQAATRVMGVMWLVEASFTQGMQRWTNWPVDVQWGGNTYRGLGELASVSDIRETDSGVGEKVTLNLSPVDTAILPLALGNVEGYRGRPINLYVWALDGNFQPVGTPLLRHTGVMDQIAIKREKDTGSVELYCVPAGANGTRRAVGLRVNHAQQQLAYPGDLGLAFAAGLVNSPQLWLSKSFQAI